MNEQRRAPATAWSAPHGTPGHPPSLPGLRVLVVCTANVSRSPLAAAMLRDVLRPLAASAEVRSAGVDAAPHLGIDRRAVDAGRELGITVGDHVPQQVTPTTLLWANLVLAMTREHVRELVLIEPTVFPRAFTLKQFVRLAVDGPMVGEPIESWVDRTGAGRQMRDLVGEDTSDDVSDPYGGSASTHRRVALELHELTSQIGARLLARGATAAQGPET